MRTHMHVFLYIHMCICIHVYTIMSICMYMYVFMYSNIRAVVMNACFVMKPLSASWARGMVCRFEESQWSSMR